MSSIFSGQNALRHQFSDLTFTDVAAATNAGNAKLIHKFRHAGRMAFLDNSLNARVVVLLVHPDADSTVAANRLVWIKVPADRVINYDAMSTSNMEFDPGTSVYIYCETVPTSGAIALATWG